MSQGLYGCSVIASKWAERIQVGSLTAIRPLRKPPVPASQVDLSCPGQPKVGVWECREEGGVRECTVWAGRLAPTTPCADHLRGG